MRVSRRRVAAAACGTIVFALVLGASGCSDDDEGGGNTVDATLSDFKIDLADDSAPAGDVTFKVKNDGPSTHEFVIFKTDLSPDDLPTDDDGNVAESDEFAPVDEIEDIESGDSPELTVNLEAGDYVIICNVPAHYDQGMRTAFTVT
jgi:uncharacterized cupredoxin-like copper-binding protein